MTESSSFYVTTPIYYVNSQPHLGHAYTTIAADVIARFQRLEGKDLFFLTGTDEHGTNIANAAEKAGMPVKEFVDANSQRFRDLIPVIDADPTFFIRTTDPEHIARVQTILAKLHENGDIYSGTYSGPYCTACEAYYNEGDLLEGELCPTHKRPTTILDETNWFFRLSAYEDKLKAWYAEQPDFVKPRTRFNEALSFIEGGLDDLSISRSSITWGVPLPWDSEQVTYVWIDALFNYYNGLGYANGIDQTDKFWPPDLQILAKDILKFHAVIWPALLMAAGLELPKQLYIHGYLLMGGDKMSKTQGNVFDPFPVIEQHGADPVRFYVLREVQFGQDGTVSQEGFEQRYTSELANDLGNLVSRSVAMALKYLDAAAVPVAPSDTQLSNSVAAAVATWREQMQRYELTAALETAWTVVRALNKHVEDRAPWQLAKDEAKRDELTATLAELVEGMLQVAMMLSPYMPQSSKRIANAFAVSVESLHGHAWGDAAGNTISAVEPMFPRLDLAVR